MGTPLGVPWELLDADGIQQLHRLVINPAPGTLGMRDWG